MTAERDDKGRQTGQPDLLASLPAERPPASQPAPGIDPAAIEELLTGMRDLREQFAGLKVSDSTERPSPVTLEALEVWGDNLVTRVAEETVKVLPRASIETMTGSFDESGRWRWRVMKSFFGSEFLRCR